jgi:RHS repeat-associated protein
LKTAKGWEADTTTARLQEQFGYAYDAAWNLQNRTNNALVQTFGVNNRNELTNATRSGTLTVAGLASQPGANLDHVVVSGTGLSAGNANVYADGSWARAGATLANGTNSYTATAEDTYGRTAQDSVTVNLPATVTFTYDANGNLTGDGRRVFEYDYENQLTNVYVASAWRESMKYDAFGRKRVLQQHQWTGSAWLLTNEVRYVYDGMLVVQERHFQPQVSTNLPVNTISYTRGNDLSDSLQGAGGIGGLLARTDSSSIQNPASSPHAYYHADGNGNITALVNTNGAVVARYQYDPYGNLLGMAGPLAEANVYRFSSKEWHANAGLYYYGFRYYEPNLQRWLNRDPIEEEGGINLYGFVANNPVSFVDLLGLKFGNPVPPCAPYPECLRLKPPRPPTPPDRNLEQARRWLQKCYPRLAPRHVIKSESVLPALGWDGFAVPYSKIVGGVVFVAPSKSADDYVNTLAHEGLHTKYGPAWGRSHDTMQNLARDIEREFWVDPNGDKCLRPHIWP